MILDERLELSDGQALTATAASTNVVDLTDTRDVGVGAPLYLVITVGTALAGTSPTFKATLQKDTAEAFSSPTTVVESQQFSSLAAGAKVVIPVPYDADERFLRVNYTLGGTSPTITVDAYLTSEAPASWEAHADATN